MKVFIKEANQQQPRHPKHLLCGMFDETCALPVSSACQQRERAEQTRHRRGRARQRGGRERQGHARSMRKRRYAAKEAEK